jgi:hypothetical protein
MSGMEGMIDESTDRGKVLKLNVLSDLVVYILLSVLLSWAQLLQRQHWAQQRQHWAQLYKKPHFNN